MAWVNLRLGVFVAAVVALILPILHQAVVFQQLLGYGSYSYGRYSYGRYSYGRYNIMYGIQVPAHIVDQGLPLVHFSVNPIGDL